MWRLAALPGRDAADHPRAVGDRLLGVEGALRAGEALADDLGVLVDQNGHSAPSYSIAEQVHVRTVSESSTSLATGGFFQDAEVNESCTNVLAFAYVRPITSEARWTEMIGVS